MLAGKYCMSAGTLSTIYLDGGAVKWRFFTYSAGFSHYRNSGLQEYLPSIRYVNHGTEGEVINLHAEESRILFHLSGALLYYTASLDLLKTSFGIYRYLQCFQISCLTGPQWTFLYVYDTVECTPAAGWKQQDCHSRYKILFGFLTSKSLVLVVSHFFETGINGGLAWLPKRKLRSLNSSLL